MQFSSTWVDDDGEEYVKEDILAAFDKTVDWKKYAYRLKMAAQKMQRGTRGAAASSSFISESRGTRGTTGKPPSIHPHPPHFVLSDFYEACIADSACASLLLLQRSI